MVVDRDEVGQAVAVNVCHDGLDRRLVGGECPRLRERNLRRCSEDADAVAEVVRRDEVGPAVAGQVGRRHRVGPGADREGLAGLERAVAVAESTLTVLSQVLAVMMSATAVASRSATATEDGCRPVGNVIAVRS